ncbi:hypothetical protein [Streptantibioticus silvisoli]|jgi:DNA-directed RNA polymerase specialized sigma24 family protein|uniref:Uncharacterized protein n=1 Tax=Streptantibioticus silvisoli TaxID=2705255 RepID=A0ABT6W4D3_9ACTN|nr:hypothetical protein [Streptantibioticus silvisoli]MDI5965617.1 hypothetical protein [Streptantibioticus silvisoli]
MAFEFFDMVFQQPDIDPNLDDLPLEAVTYPATARRDAEVWTAEVHGLPDGLSAHAEAATWHEMEEALVARVPRDLKAAPGTVIVSVEPADQNAVTAIRALTQARLNRALAEQAERDAARAAVRLLASQGWDAEDIGTVLRLPTARVENVLAPAEV